MLDWDKRLRPSQAEAINDTLEMRMMQDHPDWRTYMQMQNDIPKATGKEAWELLTSPEVARMKPSEASAFLQQHEIPGIKYLDQGSRNAPISSMGIKQLEGRLKQYKDDLAGGFGDPERMKYNIASIERELASYKPSHNYVVFDPSIVDIMKKYGIAGAAPAGMGALAAQDYYRNP
jgi:hypothetical protein